MAASRAGRRRLGSSGLAPMVSSEARSARTTVGRRRAETLELAVELLLGRTQQLDGDQHQDAVAPGGEVGVRERADAAVDVAPAVDGGRRPDTGHGATGRHGVDERDARLAVEGHERAVEGVDGDDHEPPRRPFVHGQARFNDGAPHRFGHRVGVERHPADATQRVGDGRRARGQLGQPGAQLVEVDVDLDLGGVLVALVRHRPVELAGGDLGADRRTRRRAHDEVGVGDVDSVPPEALDHPELPGDAGHAPARQDQSLRSVSHGKGP